MRHSTALTTLETSKALNQTNRPEFVSDNYRFIESASIIRQATDLGFEAVSVRQSKARTVERIGFEKHQVIMRHANYTDQDSELRIYFRNSHDRTSALQIDVGFFRFVCENGLIIGNSLIPSLKVFHIGNTAIIEKKVNDAITSIFQTIPKAIAIKDELRSRTLDLHEVHDLAIESAKVVTEIRKAEIAPTDLIKVQRSADEKLDAWSVFNVIQENALGNLRALGVDEKGNRTVVKLRKIKALDKDTKINKTLFDVFAKQLNLGKVG
jgi:hypothetical protein